ncbi:hypothetical protein GCM10027589_24040 [Actinocorallia lasiicapitis]
MRAAAAEAMSAPADVPPAGNAGAATMLDAGAWQDAMAQARSASEAAGQAENSEGRGPSEEEGPAGSGSGVPIEQATMLDGAAVRDALAEARAAGGAAAPVEQATMLDGGAVRDALAEARGAAGSGAVPVEQATMLDGGAVRDALAESGGARASERPEGRDGGVRPFVADAQATMLDQGAINEALAQARGEGARPVEQATMLDQGRVPQAGGPGVEFATMVDRGAGEGPTAPDVRATSLDRGVGGVPRTMLDGGGMAPGNGPVAVSVLLVGGAHTGQRRFGRMIAQIVGDGGYRISDAEELRGLALERLASLFDPGGQTVLLERIDAAILEAADPKAFLRTLRTVRGRARTPMIATCDPRTFKRFAQEHPELQEIFRVFRLPELRGVEQRSTLLGVLAQERRTSLDGDAWAIAREDLGRLRGPGDLTGARLVEAYLERACQRALGRGARDSLVVRAEDLTGVAESIEPSLRPAGDVDGYLRTLRDLLGIPDVKADVQRLADEAEGPVNLLFEGPPGTGKSTVAGLIGGIFGALGLLPSGHLIQCRPQHLNGRDALDTELKVAGMVQQADGGILLVQDADRLSQSVVGELFRGMREHSFMLIISGGDLSRFLRANPDVAATFQRLRFDPPSDRELVQLFSALAESKLYVVDEEVRAELMARIARGRDGDDFAYGRTVRQWFDETVVNQNRRLAGIQGADGLTVARLTVRDLPESNLRILGNLHETQRND